MPDFEREQALDGVTILGSVKSGLLVEIVHPAGRVYEWCAGVRAHVRRAVAHWIELHDSVSAAVAAAVLIGDRTALPDEVREALQSAGTYHVIAISGGNIAILATAATLALALVGVGLAERLEIPIGFWVAIALLTLFSLLSAVAFPIQQAFMNGCIPSEQRATVLSFASLMGSAGGVVAQPALGRVADVYSYGVAYVVAGVVYVLSLPFLIAVRRMGLSADRVTGGETAVAA